MLERVDEAPLRPAEGGLLVPAGEDWFIVNVAEARAVRTECFGEVCPFEGEPAFPEVGVNVRVLLPGQLSAVYHREDAQEDFLVLRGRCLAIVEDQERPMRTGDLLHAPPGTAHALVGVGEGPCTILMVGARKPGLERLYPVSEVAARHGASVERETRDAAEAYAGTARLLWLGIGVPW